ncbi:universal stress protein [Natronobacterium gregoryi]|uniref:Amino acid permease-associated region n=2 Tax=Natronobacterium gregoryi TaxID=44930 RepID=L0AJF1_NATGS|nr:universal stress protein [Natronobacterium gregoryi]AFZ73569.1 universal stress protein UspA-like protein [Natronobacterium gregoryi SP2]ELY68236.1 amino acid permease-associated region [Natronobacterium gregoryi SP2]PLK20532.1 universal stress protein [Natronobacterium gregoryi SP2]SFJ17908.1 Nucleotide-binding universal stress protein, UspA family [Natronobacterium gregoryi]
MTRILVPLAILEGETVSAGLADLLEPMDVTVLGYHVLPEQTPPDQARLQYEDRATAALEDLATEFGAADGTADYRLVFTHDEEQTFDRVATETRSDVYAIPGATGPIDRLLVALTGDVAVERIVSFVTDLVGDRDIGVTLFLATDDERSGEQLLEATAVKLFDERLHVRTDLAVDEPPLEALVDAAADHDAIVMGERAPSLRTLVFGDEAERVAAESVGPVLVVRHLESDD